MQLSTTQFNDYIWTLDNGLSEQPGLASTYLVRGDELAIVETGSPRSASFILDGLKQLGVDPATIRHIVLTHIHTDHAGGAGLLLPHMPDAQVYIHSRTARYLTETEELERSAARALGALFALNGTMHPIAPERIAAADALDLDLGRGIRLQAIATPGHSPDHLSFLEPHGRLLFTGDALGVRMAAPQYYGPVTPPPAYSVEAQLASFALLRTLNIETLLFSHFGAGNASPAALIDEQSAHYERLFALTRTAWEAGNTDAEAITQQYLRETTYDSAYAFVVHGWVLMSVNGLLLAYDRAAKKAQAKS